jgi:hypothetical protein
MMLRFAHLADYAAVDVSGKLTIVGIFDLVFDQANVRPIAIPPCSLVASFDSSVAEGTTHELRIRFCDADEQDIIDPIVAQLTFRAFGPGYPQRAVFQGGFGPDTLRVQDLGDYHFTFSVGGAELGRVSVSVLAPAPRP